jgi:hypothetical protein
MKAFPSKEPIYGDNVVGVKENSGMDLRDYFASGIASGYVRFMGCDPDARGQICDLQNADNNAEAIARSSYKIADAMMKAREKK